MENVTYDKKSLYEQHVLPLVQEIDRICAEKQIPYFFSAAIINNSEGTHYDSMARTAAPMSMLLTNDLLINHVKVSAGFDVILPDVVPDIEL